ncbi:hypothetical protein V3468_10130 [Flavobacterium oreochromis]|nr:hypothetical protein [Flavobacterium oreochromis]
MIFITQDIFTGYQNNKEKIDFMLNNNKIRIQEQGKLYGMEFNIKVPC